MEKYKEELVRPAIIENSKEWMIISAVILIFPSRFYQQS